MEPSNRRKWIFYLFGYLTIVICSFNILQVKSAVATHTHKHSSSTSREREIDGAFSPRDHGHIGEDGMHHGEYDHEAILGSAKEAEEFDSLPPEEAKKRLKILVLKMDLNQDRIIEKGELKAWILRSFRMLSEEESKERFEEVDEDKDNLISWPEYMSETYGIDDNSAIPLKDLEEQKMLADDKALFDAADKNQDGYLDNVEYLSFSHPEEDPAMLPVILAQTLTEKDRNGDGMLDFREYIGDRGKEKNTDWLKGEKEKFDIELDKDNNGMLDRNEILSWVVPSNDEIADEEVQHLMASSDDDQDGQLSYDEIIEHHDIFVGSEATDYGDHLHQIERFADEL